MTTWAKIHGAISELRESVIIPSGQVHPHWLSTVLAPLWFGGDYVPDFSMMPRDCRPVRIDRDGVPCDCGMS